MGTEERRWLCIGRDQIYEGLHGMEAACVITGTEAEAWDLAAELSRDVIRDYEAITQDLETTIEETASFDNIEDEDEIEDIRNEVYEGDISTAIFPIKEDVAVSLSNRELNELAHTMGFDSFIADYCNEAWDE